MTELPWLYAGLSAYTLATLVAFYGVMRATSPIVSQPLKKRFNEQLVLLLIVTGVLLLMMALTTRWLRIGHGPFVNLFELLISQLFSLGLVFSLAYWRVPVMRHSAVVALPMIMVLGLWVLTVTPTDSVFPPTYHNNWLWAHVGLGKFFLSFCLVGSGLAGVILLRSWSSTASWFKSMPNNETLDQLAWRFMLIAFIFDTLMLIAGAVWAQDAWGRFWQWDALETSAFLNWLALGAGLHARLTYNVPIRVSAMLIIGIFIFAFFTYFGTPFYSEAAHKGVI